MERTVTKLGLKSSPKPVDLEKLVASQDTGSTAAVNYAYDPVPNVPPYLRTSPTIFPNRHARSDDIIRLNTVPLYPLEAGLPYRSSFAVPHGARAWETNLNASITLLNLLATDKSAADIEVDHGITIAKLAKKELRPGIENRIIRATSYMFPSANKQRMKLIAAAMIYYFIFDDKIEETPDGTLRSVKEDFLYHLDAQDPLNPTASDLKRYMHGIVRSVEREDGIAGNGGIEMLDTLRSGFRCVHPEKDFPSINHYQDFRNLNVGAAFVIAAAKFSIGSSVSVSDPRFARYLTLIGDHLGLINDIYSYDKELRALRRGETSDMINIVAVIKRLMSLPSDDAAKATSYAYLLQVEVWIMQELEHFAAFEHLTDEEWLFLEAVFLSAAGNTFYCMVSARYGGEDARIFQGLRCEANGYAAKTNTEPQNEVDGYGTKFSPGVLVAV